jgi:hypothetical protein
MTPFSLSYALSFTAPFTNFGRTEMIILLVIALLVFAGSRLSSLRRVVEEGLQQFMDVIQPGKPWRLHNPRPMRQSKHLQAEVTQTVVVCSSTVTFSLLFGFGFDGQISLKQTLVALGVVAVWLAVWWLCFSKERD